MSAPLNLAIGIGCRRDCSAAAIAGLVEAAVAKVPGGARAEKALFTIAHKRSQACMAEAAVLLGAKLHFLPADALEAAMPHVQTLSKRAKSLFGVGSVAEAAALAGAGPGARLIVLRMAANGATCAIATSCLPGGQPSP